MRNLTAIFLAFTIVVVGGQTMQGQYYITGLGSGESSVANGINNSGLVIGTDESGNVSQAAIWQAKGQPVFIKPPAGDSAYGMAINDNGQVVGQFTTTGGINKPFLYSHGTVTNLPLTNATPYAINSSGQVAGYDVTMQQPFIYRGGAVSYINAPNGAAFGINSSGTVVGGSLVNGAFIYSGGSLQYLSDSPDGPAQVINDNGLVGVNSAGNGPFFYNTVSQVETWPQIGDFYIYGLNSAGTAVGQNYAGNAVIYEGGNEYDLNTLIPQNTGWFLEEATGINDKGQICGNGVDPANNANAFLLTPALPGDANLDGRVDENDLTIVLANMGQTGAMWSQGGFTGSGTVDVNDLTIVVTNIGSTAGTSGAGLAAVPEPGALALTAMALTGLLAIPRRGYQTSLVVVSDSCCKDVEIA